MIDDVQAEVIAINQGRERADVVRKMIHAFVPGCYWCRWGFRTIDGIDGHWSHGEECDRLAAAFSTSLVAWSSRG